MGPLNITAALLGTSSGLGAALWPGTRHLTTGTPRPSHLLLWPSHSGLRVCLSPRITANATLDQQLLAAEVKPLLLGARIRVGIWIGIGSSLPTATVACEPGPTAALTLLTSRCCPCAEAKTRTGSAGTHWPRPQL